LCVSSAVTPRSSDIRSLARQSLPGSAAAAPGAKVSFPQIPSRWEKNYRNIAVRDTEQPIILFLDALDQLSDADNGRLLNWIPAGPLPDNVKFVVSCLSDRVKGDPAGQPFTEAYATPTHPKEFHQSGRALGGRSQNAAV